MTILLFLAGAVAGALNAVAGGGSFLTLPTLIFAGIAPVQANATSTFALWPGSVSAAWAYRGGIRMKRGPLTVLAAVSLVGGLLGGLLLVRTSDTSFLRLLPWLMLLAAATFSFGSRLAAVIRLPTTGDRQTLAPWAIALQFVIAIYGGYFGGGMGIMMLAIFAIAGMTDIHEMNGIKSVLAAALNGVALVAFVLKGAIRWGPGLAMMVGGIAGGYVGAAAAQKVDRRHIRVFVIVIGWGMTIYFFLRRP